MPNTYFQFKRFRIEQALSGMKVTTDACLFGAWVAAQILKIGEPKQILDIGTGTGLLSLMLAQISKTSQITSLEINESAFLEAKHNFQHSPWQERLQPVHTALQDYKGQKFDLIICNPPFFSGSKKSKDKNRSQAIHSDHLSIKELINGLDQFLTPNGNCYLLYPPFEMDIFKRNASEKNLYMNLETTVRNKKNQGVFRSMARFSRTQNKSERDEIVLRDPNGKYDIKSWKYLEPYLLGYNSPHFK